MLEDPISNILYTVREITTIKNVDRKDDRTHVLHACLARATLTVCASVFDYFRHELVGLTRSGGRSPRARKKCVVVNRDESVMELG